ncbi:hypothetical protein DW777_13675 [Bacteroides sp. AM30-16]|jgi:hypothetical protein|uniref:hypothetical protein n=1 Tax=Bacteroides sp. AM30-16 TaxID=2292949 RepID=UPI000E71E169|nr:hypothetical protein [Bacteroides sp. AM30-16]RJU53706.1 hypothetical protein DW777_13675 [Bacteroides sp. AM30-16]DAT69971.1 MAG TPA: Dynein light chain type 1 [Caudoviricetes sp.]
MKRLKEKAKAIWHIIIGGQYAVYVINNGYVNKETTPKKAACLISDNASDMFLETIVDFTDRYRTDRL